MTILVVFAQDYVLTVNIDIVEKKASHIDCDCGMHVEINNFNITDIEAKDAIRTRRVRIEGKSYLAILYDQLIIDAAEYGENKWAAQSSELMYNIRFHQINRR